MPKYLSMKAQPVLNLRFLIKTKISISIKAKLVSKGKDLKLTIAADEGLAKRNPVPVLIRLIAHAFAAQDQIVQNTPTVMLSEYSKRHLRQLSRLNYQAPESLPRTNCFWSSTISIKRS